jgi:hypothetical protein
VVVALGAQRLPVDVRGTPSSVHLAGVCLGVPRVRAAGGSLRSEGCQSNGATTPKQQNPLEPPQSQNLGATWCALNQRSCVPAEERARPAVGAQCLVEPRFVLYSGLGCFGAAPRASPHERAALPEVLGDTGPVAASTGGFRASVAAVRRNALRPAGA